MFKALWVASLAALAATAWAEEPPPVPSTNPLAVVQQRVATTDIEVTYHRPRVRGRSIFGALVPWDQVWRTGADNATTVRFCIRGGVPRNLNVLILNLESAGIDLGLCAFHKQIAGDRYVAVIIDRYTGFFDGRARLVRPNELCPGGRVYPVRVSIICITQGNQILGKCRVGPTEPDQR